MQTRSRRSFGGAFAISGLSVQGDRLRSNSSGGGNLGVWPTSGPVNGHTNMSRPAFWCPRADEPARENVIRAVTHQLPGLLFSLRVAPTDWVFKSAAPHADRDCNPAPYFTGPATSNSKDSQRTLYAPKGLANSPAPQHSVAAEHICH
jgi:hypothetical protein